MGKMGKNGKKWGKLGKKWGKMGKNGRKKWRSVLGMVARLDKCLICVFDYQNFDRSILLWCQWYDVAQLIECDCLSVKKRKRSKKKKY